MICLLVSLLLAASAAAQGSTVWIFVNLDDVTFEPTTEDEVNLFVGWAAATPGLMHDLTGGPLFGVILQTLG
jgi:hypothetical protein